jgi:hypothetical protein
MTDAEMKFVRLDRVRPTARGVAQSPALRLSTRGTVTSTVPQGVIVKRDDRKLAALYDTDWWEVDTKVTRPASAGFLP